MTPVRFGLDVSTSAAPGADPVAAARTAERLGYDFVSASDHPCGSSPSFETCTMLTWIAASTQRIGIATRVLGVPYRPPAMVAKMAESLDRFSGGRLVLGLGGGYSDAEFRAFGLRVPSPRDKVDGLEEAIRICRGLWSEPAFSFSGRLYRTEAADVEPKPDHRIPIWLGTYGPRALAVTGRLADGWIPSLGSAPFEQATAMRERLLAAAAEADRDPAEITCAYNVVVSVGGALGADPGKVSGPPAAVVEQLSAFVRAGFSTLNFMPSGPDVAEQVERIAREIVPAVRDDVS